MINGKRRSSVWRRHQSSTLLAAMIVMGLTAATILTQYRYQASQEKLIHRLSDRFLAQTMADLAGRHGSFRFNLGTVSHQGQSTIVFLNDGSSFKFQEERALP